MYRPRHIFFTAAALALAAALVVASPTGAAPPANGTVLTMTSGMTGGRLWSVDPTSAAPTFIGDSSLASSTGIEWDESTQTLFGIDYDNTPASLYTIDPNTGAATVVGSMGIDRPTGIASRPGDGALFIVYDGNGGSILATVDKTTAAVTDIGVVITDQQEPMRIAAIAFRRGDGALFGFRYGGDLVEINQATGVSTIVAENLFNGYGADFDCDDTLLAIDPADGDNELARVPTDGSAPTIVGQANATDALTENLTVICGTPESTTTTSTTTSTTLSTTTTAPSPSVIRATPRFTG